MRSSRLLAVFGLLALVLVGCDGKADDTGDGSSGDGGGADGGTEDGGGTEPAVDEDRDGYMSDVDCDDNDYRIHPGAEEECDGVDQDCDGEIDEDFDADGDGHDDIEQCAEQGGDDCNDADGTIYPGADEVPYDEIDQDCDGEDVIDADGDGFDAEIAGGFDCDDTDAAINPLADEIPKDGIDQDCDGEDSLDGDGDGYDDEALGGDDCDDADPGVHPGAFDWLNDGIDADCDGGEGDEWALADAPYTIKGTSGKQEYSGSALTVCDLDEDGLDDLVITTPMGQSYAGEVAVFYGSGSASWADGMVMTDADVYIKSTSFFMGWDIACTDLDGDGHLDLVTNRGEINYSTWVTEFAIIGWYGDGSWPSTLDDGDADFEYSFPLGVTKGVGTIYERDFEVGDLDDDGASEILIDMAQGYNANGTAQNGDDSIWVIPGGRYSGSGSLDDETVAWYRYDANSFVTHVLVTEDFDGDGTNDVFLGEGYYTTDTAPDTGSQYPGLAGLLSDAGMVDAAVSELLYGGWVGTDDILFGYQGGFGDFDGDGATDAVVSAPWDSTEATDAGGVYFFSDAAGAVTSTGMDAVALADGHVAGEYAESDFGYRLAGTSDMNSDGFEELLVSEPNGGPRAYGRVYLISGAGLTGDVAAGDVSLMIWEAEGANYSTGANLGVGDFDGDGFNDLVITARTYPTTAGATTYYTGKSYVYLTGDFGL